MTTHAGPTTDRNVLRAPARPDKAVRICTGTSPSCSSERNNQIGEKTCRQSNENSYHQDAVCRLPPSGVVHEHRYVNQSSASYTEKEDVGEVRNSNQASCESAKEGWASSNQTRDGQKASGWSLFKARKGASYTEALCGVVRAESNYQN